MAWRVVNALLLALLIGTIVYGLIPRTPDMRETTRSPVYAIADALEEMAYRTDELSPRMEEAARRFKDIPTKYLESSTEWPPPGIVGVFVDGVDIIVRWIDPETLTKTSAHRLTAE